MKRLIILLLLAIIMSGCGKKEMTPQEKSAEIESLKSQLVKFLKSYESKDLAMAKSLISSSDDFMMFGTDSAEIIRSVPDFENQMKNDWQLFDSVKAGELRILNIQLANSGDIAAAIYEVPLDVVIGGNSSHMLFRNAVTYKKENGEWRLIQALTSVATVGQSSAELVEKMKMSKE